MCIKSVVCTGKQPIFRKQFKKIKEEINNTIEQYVRGGSGNSLGLTFAPKNV